MDEPIGPSELALSQVNSRTSREGVSRSSACHRVLAVANRDPAGHLHGWLAAKISGAFVGLHAEEVIVTDHSFLKSESQ